MIPTTIVLDGRFVPAVRVERESGFDIWVATRFAFKSEDEALKVAKHDVTLLGRAVVRQLIAGGYTTTEVNP